MYSNEVSARTESDRGPPGCTQKRNPISGAASGAANTVCMSAPLHEVQFWDGGSTCAEVNWRTSLVLRYGAKFVTQHELRVLIDLC